MGVLIMMQKIILNLGATTAVVVVDDDSDDDVNDEANLSEKLLL